MDALDLARWQFGITTVYHFLFVPVTIGLSLLVAILQTVWLRTGNPAHLQATKFFGKLFLINFAMGLVTGLVQEFQFGMNWSTYSRFVGDIFGAPLALEALITFFLESTFLGLWIFGWDKLPRLVHAACIWLVAIGAAMSAYLILAANSFMQWPVGFTVRGPRAELTDFGALLTNQVALATFPHVLLASWLTGAVLMACVAAWHLKRRRNAEVFRVPMRLALVGTVVVGAGILFTGDNLAKVMVRTQPMKMAAAEALYESAQPASFSLFTIGNLSGKEPIFSIDVPGLLSFLSTGSFDGKVEGVNNLQAQYRQRFGPGDYAPYIPLAYWSFRFMIGFGMLAVLVALVLLWLTRRGRLPENEWVWRAAIWAVVLPFLANSFGWLFTEMGRQPWIVFSQLKTAAAVSPTNGVGHVAASLAAFTLLYGVLAVIEVRLLLKYARQDPPEPEPATEDDGPLAFAY
ncbi:cytochrome ubiquinol oxidase subunit I [Acrocarpospora corrugata]|uniref:Cytochrome ubiquinol oxidase subunit I n=1 Tax=Acrocarpospora corrugata TaxID=35763 RepID=A0A5M3VNJ3_9ACTN|nr:cytochrome ubiquinol oxidase subunit I [Acrocarpospora corrugata]GER98356.1 cytochrome ubiquinol oxidase subunit I [Acrocarpospora corrugata]